MWNFIAAHITCINCVRGEWIFAIVFNAKLFCMFCYMFFLPFCNLCRCESPIRLHSIGKRNATQHNSIQLLFITFWIISQYFIRMEFYESKCSQNTGNVLNIVCVRMHRHTQKKHRKYCDKSEWLLRLNNKSITENPSFWLSDVWIFIDVLKSFPRTHSMLVFGQYCSIHTYLFYQILQISAQQYNCATILHW